MQEFARNIDIRKLSRIPDTEEVFSTQTKDILDLPLEVEGKPFHFKLVLGNVVDAQTDTILCPVASDFRYAGGTIADAIAEQSGKVPFQRARQYALRKARSQGRETVPFGTTRGFSSGELEQKGIHHIIFSNKQVSVDDPFTFDKIAFLVGNALEETDRVHGKTLAVPMLGTREFANSISNWESIAGTLAGIGVYQEKVHYTVFPQRSVEGLSLVAYYQATEENRKGGEELVLEAIQEVKDRLLGWNPFGAGSSDGL